MHAKKRELLMLDAPQERNRSIQLLRKVHENICNLERVVPVLAFLIPCLILYHLYPSSFHTTYQGRTFLLFFLWLVSLEILLKWRTVPKRQSGQQKTPRNAVLIIALLLPTIYVIVANYYGLNAVIVQAAQQSHIPLSDLVPLSMEYIVFAVLLAVIALLRKTRIMDFSMSTFFSASIGIIYAIDDVCPYGRFTPFQILVPGTATLAAHVLNLMGYETTISMQAAMPTLSARGPGDGSYSSFAIAWPCAGVESLVIYLVAILLFLKKTAVPRKLSVAYLAVGAIVTYLINILRIATVFVISIHGGDVWTFHNYYGWLYSLTWVVSYPLIILGSRSLWRILRNQKPAWPPPNAP